MLIRELGIEDLSSPAPEIPNLTGDRLVKLLKEPILSVSIASYLGLRLLDKLLGDQKAKDNPEVQRQLELRSRRRAFGIGLGAELISLAYRGAKLLFSPFKGWGY